LLSERYIYLEKKLGIDRKRFWEDCIRHAHAVNWRAGASVFVEELRRLVARFPDGHLAWRIPRELSPHRTPQSLGIVPTLHRDGRVYVGGLVPGFQTGLQVGDEILTWNDRPILEEVDRLGRLNPSSTSAATRERAARRLGFEWVSMPLRDRLEPVQLTVRRPDGTCSKVSLAWKSVSPTTHPLAQDQLRLTRFLLPTLEEWPSDARWFDQHFCLYFRTIHSIKVAILHPRAFWGWGVSELDAVFRAIREQKPDLLVIDLKDTAGGAFDPILALSFYLGIDQKMCFFYDQIDPISGLRTTGVGNFDAVLPDPKPKDPWKGPVALRIFTTCASGADFFPLWFQIHRRGRLVGRATTGAAGGTDEVTLPRTGTTLSFPLRERILFGATTSLEGHGVQPDWETDASLEELLPELVQQMFPAGPKGEVQDG